MFNDTSELNGTPYDLSATMGFFVNRRCNSGVTVGLNVSAAAIVEIRLLRLHLCA